MPPEDGVLLLTGDEIVELFQGREQEILNAVESAIVAHAQGDTSLPHSLFLRFPGNEKNRIIALPAYLGGEFGVAGMKWIASFPDNLARNLERASATLLLNCAETGRLTAILEGSVISSYRTAANGALAARYLRNGEPAAGQGSGIRDREAGVVGCGLINFQTVRFLAKAMPELKTLLLLDVVPERASAFERKCRALLPEIDARVEKSREEVLRRSDIVALATTEIRPHIEDLSMCRENALVLHTSLRDLTAEAILAADNIVDDVDHCCRARTSVHLAEQRSGGRDFIRGTLGDVILGRAAPKPKGAVTVFSPFGMGILDVALGSLACKLARERGKGTEIDSFAPSHWLDRRES